jgi:glyceraldehyde 3-phosphate dehydrogenase
VLAALGESIGIERAVLNTVHAYTATQSIVDGPARGLDFRRGRAGAQNMAPSSTGAALAVSRALKNMDGKFDGIAIRVPVAAGSLADITFVTARPTTVEEINRILTNAATDPRWAGIMKVTNDQIVSSDIIGEPYGAIVDLSFTRVVDGTLVKVLSWYDNEAGYVSTLLRHVARVASHIA